MTIDCSSAIIDADFVIKISSMEKPTEEIIRISQEIFDSLHMKVFIHPLVRKNELPLEREAISQILSSNVIQSPEFMELFQGDPDKEAYYCYIVPELFKILTGEEFPDVQRVFTYWVRKKSLGEVHSVSLCIVCGCGIFLSDDYDSKYLEQIVRERMLGNLHVYNRQEVIARYMETEAPRLDRAERRSFSHQKRQGYS